VKGGGRYYRELPTDTPAHCPRRSWNSSLADRELQRGISRKRLCLYAQVRETLDQFEVTLSAGVVSDAQTAYAVPELRAGGAAWVLRRDRHFR